MDPINRVRDRRSVASSQLEWITVDCGRPKAADQCRQANEMYQISKQIRLSQLQRLVSSNWKDKKLHNCANCTSEQSECSAC